MKERKIGIIVLLIIIITCFIIFFILIGVLFIDGTDSIIIELEFANRINDTWAFIKESNSGWATEHHITNFIFGLLFSSVIFYLLRFFNEIYRLNERYKLNERYRNYMIGFTIIIYLSYIGLTLFYATCGEIIEQTFRIIFGEIFKNNEEAQENFNGYSSETVSDVILSDLVQSILANLESLLFLIFIFHEVGSLLFTKIWYIIIFRIVIILIFTPTGFITTLKKDFSGTTYNIGFYAQMFLKIALIYILFLEDFIHTTSIKNLYINLKDVFYMYIFITIYLILQWIATWNLTLWGLISSNVVTIILFFILLTLKHLIYFIYV